MERWISVGIPLETMDTGDNVGIYHMKEIFQVPKPGYRLWEQFRNGNSPEAALQSAGDFSEAEARVAEDCMKDFISSRLLVPLSDAIRRKPLRQGTARGLADGQYTVQCSESVQMPFFCYIIWCYADGQTSPAEILAKMNAKSMRMERDEFLNAYYRLLQTDALALT